MSKNSWRQSISATTIRLVERDEDVVELLVVTPNGDVTVICEMEITGQSLVLGKLHIDGPGAGSLGLRELKNIIRLYGVQQGVRKVIVRGAMRTTGAHPGHVPREIIIDCEDPDGQGNDSRLA